LKLTILFGHAESETSGQLYNIAVMVDPDGKIIGRHRKLNTIAEQWAEPGKRAEAVDSNGLAVGIMVCADAYTDEVAQKLRAQGARLLVSPAAWGQGRCGPRGEWEQRSLKTGLPLIVCNRTSSETKLDFTHAESVFIKDGGKILSHHSKRSAVLTFDLDLKEMLPLSNVFNVNWV
jgi:N-carbamoylputrescine amidase